MQSIPDLEQLVREQLEAFKQPGRAGPRPLATRVMTSIEQSVNAMMAKERVGELFGWAAKAWQMAINAPSKSELHAMVSRCVLRVQGVLCMALAA